jgi:uncharacterized protein
MSRSNPPRSSIVERVRESSHGERGERPRRSLRRRLNIKFAALIRWLHIYLSMFGLAAILFFSVTGITLNHPDWFSSGAERSRDAEGTLDVKWMHVAPSASAAANDADRAHEVAKLEVVEHLRKSHGVRGALSDFRVDERECMVAFKGPGYAADAFIDRETGHYRVTITEHGWIAVINDLHKGRDTGPAWSILIDVSAVVMTVVSMSGLLLLFYLKLRRKPGLVVTVVGLMVVVAAYLLFVP